MVVWSYPQILPELDPFPDRPRCSIPYVWGCSDGLVLLGFRYASCCYVGNPATGELRKIPNPTSFSDFSTSSAWGLGYVSSIDGYKIVCFLARSEFHNDEIYVGYKYEVEAFTLCLKTGTWKQVCFFDGLDLYEGDLDKLGVVVNEISYWLLRDGIGERFIIWFDLVGEEFIELDPLKWMIKYVYHHLTVIGGCLCLVSSCDLGLVDISMLKEDGGSTSWVKFCIFDQLFD